MLSDCLPPRRTALRRALLCLLLLGVLLHGQAGVLRQLLGTAHWHQPAPTPAAASPAWAGWLAQVQAWRQQVLTRSPLIGGHAEPGHAHRGSERHHHASHDATVVALEPGGDTADALADALAGSLLQPLAWADPPHWPGLAPAGQHWPRGAAAAWRNASARLPDRPPRG